MGAVLLVPMWWMTPYSGLGVAALGRNQKYREFLEQFLYLGRESGNGSGCLCTQGLMKEAVPCPGEGAARSRVQTLLLRGGDGKAKFCKEIHAK
jgi:hypothetical protein